MGLTINKLSSRKVGEKAIFNNRFVVEICEKVHVHYRNLRLLLSLQDFLEIAKGIKDSLSRWEAQGRPEPREGIHIELCRKQVAKYPLASDSLAINLNKNLYLENEGKIFAEGAELEEPRYIHLKVRDVRLELTLSEFSELSEAVLEAKRKLDE